MTETKEMPPTPELASSELQHAMPSSTPVSSRSLSSSSTNMNTPLVLTQIPPPQMPPSTLTLRVSSSVDSSTGVASTSGRRSVADLPPAPPSLRLEPHSSSYIGDSAIGLAKIEQIVKNLQHQLCSELDMEEVRVPFDGDEDAFNQHPCQCKDVTIFHTKNYKETKRLLVIIPYREAGIWSRSICLNSADTDAGSMIPYLEKAILEGYGVLIMNPAAQACHSKLHVGIVWDQFIKPLSSVIFILAFSRGCQLVKQLLNHDNGKGIMQDRIRSLALVEPSHTVSDQDTYFARRVLSRRAVAWLLSWEVKAGEKIEKMEKKHGCICVSAGPIPANVTGSSGGWALKSVMTSVFGSFAARYGKISQVTVNNKKINQCGMCHRRLGLLNRRMMCNWCEVKYCSKCCQDKYIPAFQAWQICQLCQILPCLIDPRRQKLPNATSTRKLTPPTNSKLTVSQPMQKSDSNSQSNISKNPNDDKSSDVASSGDGHFDSDLIDRGSIFIHPKDVDDLCLSDFEIIKFIGRGACGRVKLVRKNHGADEGTFYAMKSIKKKLVMQRGLVQATNAERRILDRINHPFITTLCYAFQNEAKLYLLSKYYPGGNLLDQMRIVRHFTEERARLYTAEVALALYHLHSNNIIYRDLKLENVLVDAEGHVALTDFGMSKEKISRGDTTSTFVGTYQMMAPDILTGKAYTRAIDWWALGVMVYEMIDGRTPFNAKSNKLIKDKILHQEEVYSSRFSIDAKDFVSKLLTKDPTQRLGCVSKNGIEEIQQHKWFEGLDWDLVFKRQVTFLNQESLMLQYAKEYVTGDVFDHYMHALEVACDTPVSCKSSHDELFNDFAYNYMDNESSNDGTLIEGDENEEQDDSNRPQDPLFDLSLLRPDQCESNEVVDIQA